MQTNTFKKIYITGDTHGNFSRIERFCEANHTTTDDLLIILGDAGINYYLNERDASLKHCLSELPITLPSIPGNHEDRPDNIPTYSEIDCCGDKAYAEQEYPNLIFAKDGSIYNLNGARCLVLGGAYSVDKYYRLQRGWQWFTSEQIADTRKSEIEAILDQNNWNVNYVLSHTCPYNERPVHMFLHTIDQSTVDNSMEVWLQKIADKLQFTRWYFGHYHDDWDSGKYSMFYMDTSEFPYFPPEERDNI